MSLHRRAARRDTNEGEIVTALLAAGATVLRISVKDAPDLLVGFRGVNFLFETKRPPGARGGVSRDGQRLSEDQAKWHAAWRGLRPIVIHTVAEALAAIGATSEDS